MRLRTTLLGLASGLCSLVFSLDARAYDTRSVVIVGIDGLRDEEGVLNRVASPPGQSPYFHPYLPRIWSELVPHGTLYRNAHNLGRTYTTPGYNTLLSGVWQSGPNRGPQQLSGRIEARSITPLLVELFNQTYPGDTAWVATDKSNTMETDFSFHPLFGPRRAASMLSMPAGQGDEVYYGDVRLYPQILNLLQTQHPRFLFINLGSVDFAGHSGDFAVYRDAILRADTIVADLWEYLQADPFYRNTTTLALSSDHGRHRARTGGFQSHGGQCDGCRSVFTLIAGPDTPEDQVIERQTLQIDVAPTIAQLLGMPLSTTRGEILCEALGQGPMPRPRMQYDPEVAAVGDDVFLTYTELSGGRENVKIVASRNDGRTFGALQQLNNTAGSSAYAPAAHQATVAVNPHGIQVAWLDLANPLGRVTLLERTAPLQIFRSLGRLDFGSPMLALGSVIEGERPGSPLLADGATLDSPRIVSVSGGTAELLVTGVYPQTIFSLRSTDGFLTHDPNDFMAPAQVSYHESPRIATGTDGNLVVAAWQNIGNAHATLGGNILSWDILLNVSRDGGRSWLPLPILVTDNITTSITPEVVVTPDNIAHVFYSDEDANGLRQVFVRSVSLPDLTLGPTIRVSNSTMGAWQPTAVVDPLGRIIVVYVDYATGQGDLYASTSTDGTTWLASESALVETPGMSQKPRAVLVGDGAVFIAWEETTSTGSTVRFTRARL